MKGVVKVLLGLAACLLIVGLAAPWAAMVQEAANRAQCRDNLKQIALAVHNYCDAHGGWFPAGTVPHPHLPPERRLSWMFALVVFVEGNKNWRHVDQSQPWDAEANQFFTFSPAQVYQCPSQRTALAPSGARLTGYAGIAGLGAEAALLPREDRRAGLFAYTRRLTFRDITDGSACTLMVAETDVANGPWAAGGPGTVRGVDPDRQPYFGEGGSFERSHDPKWYWSGVHGASHIAFADGSVRTMKSPMKSEVFEVMATYAGGEEIPEADF